MEMIAERRANPGMDDLIDVLVHSEVDGERLSDAEIFMGLGLLGAAGNDSTRSVFTSGMLGLFENPDQLRLLIDDPSLIPGAVEELLRCYPAFAHFRRTATREVEIHGKTIGAGDKVLLWYVAVEPRRATSTTTRSASTSPASPTTRRSVPAAGTSASARRSRGSRSRCCCEETLRRFPRIELAGEPTHARSLFLNQLKTLPVRLNA